MLLFLTFDILLFCSGYQSYSVNDDAKKNEMMIEKILSSYVKPIKRLTANFPNHEVEFQIEFQKQFQQPSQRTPQRRFVLYKQPQNRNRRILDYKDPYDVEPGITKASTTTTPVVTSPSIAPITTDTPELTTKKRRVTITETPERKPVYLEDLQKIFDEFADKIKPTQCNGYHATTNQYPPQIVISNPGPVHRNRNINEVVELIRKGVHVRKHVPRPTDEDLDWLQIKIPS